MLVTMGGMGKNGECKPAKDYIPFEMLRKQWQTVVLKLIRKQLSQEEKKKVQPLLQQAYSNNEAGFYVHAPKQKGDVKTQLSYIGRYMRRPAIAVSRIEAYDGEFVTFRYTDKTDGKEKSETVSVEEFIARVIVIFRMNNSRRTKSLSKKLVTAWQKEARK